MPHVREYEVVPSGAFLEVLFSYGSKSTKFAFISKN